MSDDVDRAGEWEQRVRDEALRAQAQRAGLAGKTLADSAEFCAVCGGAVPQARRRAVPGCQRCVACQGLIERSGRGVKQQGREA